MSKNPKEVLMDRKKPRHVHLRSHLRLSKNQSLKRENDLEGVAKAFFILLVSIITYTKICTRPNVPRTLGVESHFMYNPRRHHWDGVD